MSFCGDSGLTSSSEDLRPASPNAEEEPYVWTLSDELKELALKELGETEQIRNASLAEMRRHLDNCVHLRHSCRRDNRFLLRFLRYQKFNVAKACATLEKYLAMRIDHPRWFQNLDPSDKAIADLADSGFLCVLPDRDSHGRLVIVNHVTGFDIDGGYTNSDVMRLFMCIFETVLEDEENQIRGITYIFYCKNITLAHLSIWSPSEAAVLFGSCEKNIPGRHRDINLVSLPFSVWFALEFVKQFLSWKMKRRIHTLADDKKLCQKFDSGRLPVELGGSHALSLGQMGSQWRARMLRRKSALLALEDMTLACQKESAETESKSAGIWSYIPGMAS